jgi:hypothetical protein
VRTAYGAVPQEQGVFAGVFLPACNGKTALAHSDAAACTCVRLCAVPGSLQPEQGCVGLERVRQGCCSKVADAVFEEAVRGAELQAKQKKKTQNSEILILIDEMLRNALDALDSLIGAKILGKQAGALIAKLVPLQPVPVVRLQLRQVETL